jgi:hypothetical protein
VTINNQQQIQIVVSGGDSPGATGRAVGAVGAAANGALETDRRQTLSAVSG